MPEKSLFSQIGFGYIWLAVLTALWGGMISYFHRVQQGMKHSWISAAAHLGVSGFAGLICWLGCIQFQVAPPLTAIFTGLAGHMGVEFIKLLESKFEANLNLGHTHHRSGDEK